MTLSKMIVPCSLRSSRTTVACLCEQGSSEFLLADCSCHPCLAEIHLQVRAAQERAIQFSPRTTGVHLPVERLMTLLGTIHS